jgi:hypothetical protein
LSDDKVAEYEAREAEKKIQRLAQERIVEYDRYYQTVLLTLGFKNYLETYARDCKFVFAEPRFQNSEGVEVRPDMVLQYDGKRGILCEIKTSFPLKEEHLLSTLKQLERYSQEISGWETSDRKVDSHDTLVFCYAYDYDRVYEKFDQWSTEGVLKVSNVSMCEWMLMPNPKTAKEELIIRLRNGKTGCEELNSLLKKNISIDPKKLAVELEQCKFTRKEPPVEYTMVELWMNIFSEISKEAVDFEVSIRKLLEIVYSYYIKWSNVDGEYSQVRERWIKKAIQGFCDIGLAEEIREKPDTYTIFVSKNVPSKDFKGYVIEKLCEKVVGAKISKKPVLEIDKNARLITDFFS